MESGIACTIEKSIFRRKNAQRGKYPLLLTHPSIKTLLKCNLNKTAIKKTSNNMYKSTDDSYLLSERHLEFG